MRLMHVAIALGIVLALATAGFADTVTLKSGRVIHGTYLGGTARQLRVDTGDRVENLDVGDVVRIEFGDFAPAPTPRASSDEDRPRLRRAQPDSQPTILRPDSDPPPAPAPAAAGGEPGGGGDGGARGGRGVGARSPIRSLRSGGPIATLRPRLRRRPRHASRLSFRRAPTWWCG